MIGISGIPAGIFPFRTEIERCNSKKKGGTSVRKEILVNSCWHTHVSRENWCDYHSRACEISH